MAHESEPTRIGRRIASLRKRRGTSQATVSRRAGIDPSYLSRIETGRIQPTVRTAMKIARALRSPIEDLLGPTPPQRTSLPCPVSQSGQCLMDLIDVGDPADAAGRRERYSARQLKLLKRFAALVRRNNPDILKAFEVLVTGIRTDDAPPDGTT